MSDFLKWLVRRFLRLRWQQPHIIVVLDKSGVDSLWISRQAAEFHVAEMNQKAAKRGFDLGLHIASPNRRGHLIIDAEQGFWVQEAPKSQP